jgi:small conductance mechanosensitive channel
MTVCSVSNLTERTALAGLLVLSMILPASLAAEDSAKPDQPITTADPRIPTDELALLLNPLSKEELLIEAEGWQGIVRAKAEEIARAEIAVKRQTRAIEKAAEIKATAESAREQLNEVARSADEAKENGGADKLAEAEIAASRAQEAVADVVETVDGAVASADKAPGKGVSDETRQSLDEAARAATGAKEAVAEVEEAVAGGGASGGADAEQVSDKAQEAAEAVGSVEEKVDEALAGALSDTQDAAAMEAAARSAEQAEAIEEAEKLSLLETVTKLREERTLLIDNMRTVIDELEAKTHKDDADTQAAIRDYRLYISGVSGINVDVRDTTSAWASLSGWATSAEGGLRWLENLATFAGILILAWFLAKLFSRLLEKAMGRMSAPALLADFLVRSVRWVVMLIGIIWALTALEVSVAPLLAMVGAAGFIIAFAMQDSLSNFASGLMILFFRPFDMGDFVEAGGVSGKVSSMNLVSTTIRTVDNKMMVVPNSRIWSDVITNVTGVTQRRVDMEFGIGYDDDIDKAEKILEEIVNEHPKVLKEPVPTIRLSALADSSVNFICRPWSRPDDYWDVYWDITRTVKKRFDAAGIGIPFPQRDVHLYIKEGAVGAGPAPAPGGRGSDTGDGPQGRSGDFPDV